MKRTRETAENRDPIEAFATWYATLILNTLMFFVVIGVGIGRYIGELMLIFVTYCLEWARRTFIKDAEEVAEDNTQIKVNDRELSPREEVESG